MDCLLCFAVRANDHLMNARRGEVELPDIQVDGVSVLPVYIHTYIHRAKKPKYTTVLTILFVPDVQFNFFACKRGKLCAADE